MKIKIKKKNEYIQKRNRKYNYIAYLLENDNIITAFKRQNV